MSMDPITLRLTRAEPGFRLEIANASNKAVAIWSSQFALGYYALSLLVSGTSGPPCVVKRKPVRWTVNVPASITIEPGTIHVEMVNLYDRTWDTSQCRLDARSEVAVRAVLEIARDENTNRYGVLTGRFESSELRVSAKEIVN